jgi:soluble lytic murein transglycosylase-like protein
MRVADDMRTVLACVEQVDRGPADFGGFEPILRAELERGGPRARAARTIPAAAIEALIAANAPAYSVDPALVRSIVEAESGFDPRATSPAGARGLMQLMPETARSLGVSDAYDPAQNLRGGVRYLRGLLDRFGDVRLAIAAYNAGPAAVERFGGVPPYSETRAYVQRVLARRRELDEVRAAAVLKPATLR